MARGDDKAATKAGHMAALTSNAVAQLTLANGEPSTQGAKRTCSCLQEFDRAVLARHTRAVAEAYLALTSATIGRRSKLVSDCDCW